MGKCPPAVFRSADLYAVVDLSVRGYVSVPTTSSASNSSGTVPSPMPVTIAAMLAVSFTKYSALIGSKNRWPRTTSLNVIRQRAGGEVIAGSAKLVLEMLNQAPMQNCLHQCLHTFSNEKGFRGETSETLGVTGSSTWARTRDLRINRAAFLVSSIRRTREV